MAQGSAFTYQGWLKNHGAPANDTFDFRFLFYDAVTNGNSTGNPVLLEDVTVTNGMLSVTIDPGAATFDGSPRWLEFGVREGSSTGDYTILSPRQSIEATPYAIRAAYFSGLVAQSQLPASVARLDGSNQVFTGLVQFNNPSNSFSGFFTGNGSALTNLIVATNLSPDVGQLVRFPYWLSYSNNYPITILAVGDSLAVPPSMTEQVAKRLQERFGANGWLTDSYLASEPYPTNFSGAIDAGPDTNWFSRYHQAVGNGAGIAWGSASKPNGVTSDQVQLFWIQTPDGGPFDLQVMANGGPWMTIKSLSGFNATRRGAYTNVPVAYNYNRFRVINTANATNSILFHGPYYSGWGSAGGSCGVRYAAFGYAGLSMASWTNVPAAIKDVILTNLNPALIISFNLESTDPVQDQWLPEYFRWLSLCRSTADIAVVGCYDFGANLVPAYTIHERQMWFTNAMRYGASYFDLQNASGGFYNMFTNGFLVSYFNPHPNATGQIAIGRWFEERFDLARFWLISDKSPPYKLYLRNYDSTNSPFGVFHTDAAGSSSVFIGGSGNSGAIWLGGDHGSLANAALFGNQNQTIFNSPVANDGPYFSRQFSMNLGQFITDGTLSLNYGLRVTTGLTNGSATPSRLAFWDSNRNLTSAAANGPVPINADGSATTAAQVMSLLSTSLASVAENSTSSVQFNSAGRSETVYNANPATLASLTITLPSSSVSGQVVRYLSAGSVISLTVSGTVLIGAAVTNLPANGVLAWQATDSTGQWLRTQ